MTTFTALTTLKGEAAAAALAEAVEALDPSPTGVGIFEMEDGSGTWEIGAYFTERPDIAGLDLLAAVHGARGFAVSKVEDRDWVAQVRRELTPVEAGRFVVYGSHDRDRIAANRIGLEIEAAMAFGTGHHGTTQGCLLALDGLVRANWAARNVADIGTGTGVLAMAARKVWQCRTVASDIDDVAVATARANVAANRLTGIPAVRAAGFRSPVLRDRAPFDLIFANILARPLMRLAPDMAAHVAPGGRIILSGILVRQFRRVEGVYTGHRFHAERRIRIGDWVTLVMRRV